MTRGLFVISAVAIALAPLATGCGTPGANLHLSRQPKLRVDVAAGCPKSLSGYADVVNTYRGPKLVPADPTGGILCRYRPMAGTRSPTAGQLAQQTRFDTLQADHVAEAVRSLDLRTPTGSTSCPADIGTADLIGLSYHPGPDVGLWYADSGCKTLDNGRLGSFEVGNPSFYETFENVIANPSTPPEPPVAGTIVTSPPVVYTIPAGQTPNGQPITSTTIK